MKKYVVFTLALVITIVASATSSENDGNLEIIDYDVNRIAKLQISPEQLANMNTEQLLQACLDFPYSIDLILYGCNQKGFEQMAMEFNGYKELFDREDLIPVLIQEYRKLPSCIEKTAYASDVQKGKLSLRTLLLEFIIMRDGNIDKMTNDQICELLPVIENNARLMKNRADIFSGIHAIPIMMLKESTVVKSPNFPVLSSILSYSLSWLPTTIKTPKNTTIYSAQYFTGIDYNSTEQAAIKAEIESVYSPAQVVEPATWTYNCHSYAWHLSQGETSVVWLNAYDETHPTHGYYLQPYWTDGSFIASSWSNCTQVLYPGDHSALKHSNDYISKWGDGPVVIHSLTNVPSGYKNPSGSSTYTYYRRNFSIVGDGLITSSSAYYVNGLTSGCSVTWSLSNSYYSQNCMQTNCPSINQCTITRASGTDMYEGILTATVSRNNKEIGKLTRKISAYTGFRGTYYNGQTTANINYPYPLYVLPNTIVRITSPNIINSTVTHQGDASITMWALDTTEGTLRVGMPSSGACVVTVTCTNGSSYILPIIVSSSINLSVISGDGQMMVSIESEAANKEMQNNVNSISTLKDPTEGQMWILEVFNSTTGEKMCYNQVTGPSYTIDTTGWKSGVYIVRVIIGDKIQNGKVIIK